MKTVFPPDTMGAWYAEAQGLAADNAVGLYFAIVALLLVAAWKLKDWI